MLCTPILWLRSTAGIHETDCTNMERYRWSDIQLRMLPPARILNMSHAQVCLVRHRLGVADMGSRLPDASTKTISWTKGGFQDARASPAGAEWYIENVSLTTSVLTLRILKFGLHSSRVAAYL